MQMKATSLAPPKTPTSAKGGLAASKYAEEPEPTTPEVKTEEGEHDSSSAALASVRAPFLS